MDTQTPCIIIIIIKSTENQIYSFEFLTMLKNKVNIMTYVPMELDLGVAPWLDMLHNAL